MNKTLEQLKDISDAAIAAQDKAIAAFAYGVEKTAAELRAAVIEYVSSAAADPKAASKAQALVNISASLQKQLNKAGYTDLVNKYLAGYDDQTEHALAALKAMKVTPVVLAPADQRAIENLKKVDYDYLQGLGQTAVHEVARGVIQNTILGTPRAKIIERVRATLDTKLKNYACTYADTALVTYDRTVSMEIWQKAGIEKYLFRGPRDIKNRPFCAKTAGQVYTLAEIKKLSNGTKDLSNVLRFGGGWNCRHVWSPWPADIPVPEPPPAPAAATPRKPPVVAQQAAQPAPAAAPVPPPAPPPPPPPKPAWTLKTKAPGLGGAHPKEIWTDADGNDWLFKPMEPGKGIIPWAEEAASKVAQLVNAKTAVEVRTITLDGKFGSIQKMVPLAAKKDFTSGQGNAPVDLATIPAAELKQIQREHVLDWLISNHDGHPGQFLRGKDGNVYGIDKAQAFKHLGKDALSPDYHPNSAYGEQEPLYNTLLKAAKKGHLKLDPMDAFEAIKAVEAIPDADYLKAIEGYADFIPSVGGTINQFNQKALARKHAIRKDFEKLYADVLLKPGFKFEPAPAPTKPAAAPPAAKTPAPAPAPVPKPAPFPAVTPMAYNKATGQWEAIAPAAPVAAPVAPAPAGLPQKIQSPLGNIYTWNGTEYSAPHGGVLTLAKAKKNLSKTVSEWKPVADPAPAPAAPAAESFDKAAANKALAGLKKKPITEDDIDKYDLVPDAKGQILSQFDGAKSYVGEKNDDVWFVAQELFQAEGTEATMLKIKSTAPVKIVNLADLHAVQNSVSPDLLAKKIEQIASEGLKAHATVVKLQGVEYILDGNHTLSAAKLGGLKSAPVYYIDADNPPPTLGAAPPAKPAAPAAPAPAVPKPPAGMPAKIGKLTWNGDDYVDDVTGEAFEPTYVKKMGWLTAADPVDPAAPLASSSKPPGTMPGSVTLSDSGVTYQWNGTEYANGGGVTKSHKTVAKWIKAGKAQAGASQAEVDTAAAEAAAAKAAADQAMLEAQEKAAEAAKLAAEAEAKRLARNAANRARRAKKSGPADPGEPEEENRSNEWDFLDAPNAGRVKEAAAAGWQGKALTIDKDQIEDQNVLVWQEKGPDGKARTALRFKVRPDAQDQVLRTLGLDPAKVHRPASTSSTPLPSDFDLVPMPPVPSKHLFKKLVSGDVSVGDPKTTFKTGYGTQLTDQEIKEITEAYAKWKLERDAAKKKLAAGKKKPAASALPFTVEQGRVTADSKRLSAGGDVTVTDDDVPFESMYSVYGVDRLQQVNLTWPDGTRARWVPFNRSALADGVDEDTLFSLQGTFEMILPGKADAKLVDQALRKITETGLKGKAATAVDEELMYLKKQAYVSKLHQDPEWVRITRAQEQQGTPDELRVAELRQFWNRRLGVADVTKLPEYNPRGEYEMKWDDNAGANRAGRRLHRRFDISEAKLAKEMKGYLLYHDPRFGGGNIENLYSLALPTNRQMVSTLEKVRAGVTRKGAGSPGSDLGTGGASYVYTRVKSASSNESGIYWKPSALRRMDAVSYPGDKFGRTVGKHVEQYRKVNPTEWKAASRNIRNETVFKDGLHLLHDVEVIYSIDKDHRTRIVSAFKAAGYSVFPDGRKVEDVVKVGTP
jgi:hypothetical protein